MNIKRYLALMGVALALVAGSSSAATIAQATIWEPTDTNVQIISYTAGAEFGVFEDLSTDGAGFATPVISFVPNVTGQFSFTANANPGDWDLALMAGLSSVPPNDSGTLLGSDNFKLGWWNGSAWEGDSNVISLGGSIYSISFGGPLGGAATLTIDVGAVPVQTPPVPLPAAAWLFGSALLGLVGVARRKRASNV